MKRLSERARIAIVAGCGTVAAFFVFGGMSGLGLGGGGAIDPEAAIPKNAFLVATANLAELRRSPLYEVLLSDKPETSLFDRKAFGVQRLTAACGFDPLTRVEKLVVAVPEDGEKGELGVAARVTATAAELEKCTTAIAENHGEKAAAREVHGFSILSAQGAEVGYGHELLVAGKGAWFDTMLATADGKNPSAKASDAHVAIRSYLTSQNGWGAPTVLVSALLPDALRNRIKNEMAGEVGEKNAAQSAMGGVLGVSGIGIALKAGAHGGSIDAAAELVCDTEDACAGVQKLVEKKRFEWSKELMLRMVGFGPLLDSITIKRDGTKLLVTAAAPADALAATLDRVLRLRGGHRAPDEMPSIRPAALPTKPDEQIPAPRPPP